MILLLCGCSSKVDAVRDSIARGEAPNVEAPACTARDVVGKDQSACLSAIARALGSKKDFEVKDPDQADAAAVAVVLVRERRGDWVPAPETWLIAEKASRGPGADALRLAVASRMAELAPRVGKRIEDEQTARELARDLATAMPGSCPAYTNTDSGRALRPEETPDHDPCIQRDLERREGPGASYGYGDFRALEGALAMWRDEARALRGGVELASGAARDALAAKLAAVEAATAKIDVKKVEPPGKGWSHGVGDLHEQSGAVPAPSGTTR